MRFSLYFATCLVLFLISSTVFATRSDSPRATLFLRNHVDKANYDHPEKDGSKSGLWSGEREKKMEINPLILLGKIEKIGNRRTLQIAGSRLPDCLHACGSCSPCRLVTVSFACALNTEEAESCPISYRCMCNSKSYPIP